MTGITWADYVRARGLTFPEGRTWTGVPREEYRRLTRNWRAWRRRRLRRMQVPFLDFRFTKTGRLVRVGPNGETWGVW